MANGTLFIIIIAYTLNSQIDKFILDMLKDTCKHL